MRADNNWEDKIGKRLHDFEGELSPQAWNNINKKIQPKRRNRWFFWLPLILVLFSIPAGLYYSGKLKTVLNTAEKPGETIVSKANPVSNIALNPANQVSETVAEPAQKVPQPVDTKVLTENQKTENQSAKTDAISAIKEKEHLASNSTITSKTRRTKKDAIVIIPDRETKELASGLKNADKENPENAGKTRKPGINNSSAFAAKSFKKKAGNSVGKNGIVTERKPAETSDFAVIENSKQASGAKKAASGSEVNSAGNNFASGKTVNPKTEPGNTEDSKEISGTTNPQEIKNSAVSDSKTEQNAGTALGRNEVTNPSQGTADFLIPKTDSVATKAIATADSTEKKKQDRKKQWVFSVYGTPHYTFQRVKPNENDDTKILRLNNKNDIESERLGYEFGLRGYYPLKDKLQLEFGAQFAHVTQHLNFTTASQFADSAVVYQQNNTINIDVYNRELKQLYLIKYTLAGLYAGLNKTFDGNLSLNGGVGANWILSSVTVPASTRISNASFAPYLSAGLNYAWPLNQALELQAGPNFQYYLKPLQKKEGLFCTEPTVFGFKVGILFKSKP